MATEQCELDNKCCLMMGTLGVSEHRNTAEKNRQIPQYSNTVSKLDVILRPLTVH